MRGAECDLAENVGGEALLSVLLLDSLLPTSGREIEHATVRPARQQTEEVTQVAPGLDRVELAAREQGHEGRVDLASVIAADKEPVAASYNFTPQGELAPIVHPGRGLHMLRSDPVNACPS